MTTRPFIPRPKDRPAWWAEEATPEEMAAHIRLRYAMEQLQKEARRERSQRHPARAGACRT